MKYKVKDLLDQNNLVSHLFLDCLGRDSSSLIDSIIHQDGYDVETSTVDIKLKFNGVEKDITRFLKHFEEEYDKEVDKKVKERVYELLPHIDWVAYEQLQEGVKELVEEFEHKILKDVKPLITKMENLNNKYNENKDKA